MKKRILAIALAMACAISSFSLTAFADSVRAVEATPTLHYDFTTGLTNTGSAEADDAELNDSATRGNEGVVLNGNGGQRQAVKITGKSMKNAINSSEAVTMSWMVKAAANDDNRRTLFSWGRGEQHRIVVMARFDDSVAPRWSIQYKKSAEGQALNAIDLETKNNTEFGKVLKGKWTNVTFVQDGDTLSLYVNGEMINRFDDVTTSPADIASVADVEGFYGMIGAPKDNIYAGDPRFEGTISDFRIYDQALSADDVKAVYDETLASVNYGSLTSARIEAENFSYWNRAEVAEGAPKTEGGDSYKAVANTYNGLTLTYKNVKFDQEIESVTAHVKGGTDKVRPDTAVKFYLDSADEENLIATIEPYALFTAGGWNWVDATAPIDKDLSGTHDLIVVMTGTAAGGGNYMGNYDYFDFFVNRQTGLKATFYQTQGLVSDQGRVLGGIVEKATGEGDNYHNSQENGNLDEFGRPAEKNKLFDKSKEALLAGTQKVGTKEHVTDFKSIDSNADTWSGFVNSMNAQYNDTLLHYSGTARYNDDSAVMDIGSLDFKGKIDNGMVIEFTDPDTSETTRVFEYFGNRSWADGTEVRGAQQVPLVAGKEYNIDAWYVKYGGGQMFDIKVKNEMSLTGEEKRIDDFFTLDMTVEAYCVNGFNGDFNRVANAIEPGSGSRDGVQTPSLEGMQMYDDTIDAVRAELVEVGKTVIPTLTFNSNDEFTKWTKQVGGGGDAVLADISGYIIPLKTGDYSFGFAKIDNNAILEIDTEGNGNYTRVAEYWASKKWYDNDTAGTLYGNQPTVHLEAGKSYPLRATFLELDGGQLMVIKAKTTDSSVNDVLIDDAFVFSTAPLDTEFNVKDSIPTLGPVALGATQVAYLDFESSTLPQDLIEKNDRVTVDETLGAAVFTGGGGANAPYLELKSSVSEAIRKARTLIVEMVVKNYGNPGHGYIASMGTEAGKLVLCGQREQWGLKTQSTECYQTLPYGQWTKVKYVFSLDSGVKIYANDKLVKENANEKQALGELTGNFRIGKGTHPEWIDQGFNGKMAEFRISVTDQPVLDAEAPDGGEVLSYVNFANDLPEGVENQGVEIANGIGKFTGGKSTAIVFPESVTDSIKKAETFNIEFVIKANTVGEHKVIASLGTTSDGHAHIIMGTRQNGQNKNALKSANGASSNDALVPGQWTKVRYEITRTHTNIYSNGNKVLDSDEVTNFAMLAGALKFGQFTVSQWQDDGLDGFASEIRVSTKGEYAAPEYPEQGLVEQKDVNQAWPSGSGDYYYDDAYKFTNVVPGVYKIAYTISGVNIKSEDWQMRVSPRVRSCGGFERRCWVDFRYVSLVKAAVDANELGDKIMVVAVINVPEGYNEISPGAYIEAGENAGLGSQIDSIRLYTGKYDLAKVEDYKWAVEVPNLSTPNEDSGGLLRAFNGTWKPSTRGETNDNTALTSVKVDGVDATIEGDTITAEVPKATSHNIEVTTEDPYAYYMVAEDQKTITVWSSNDTEKVYNLELTELFEAAQPDENGIIQAFPASGFANGHTWDGGVPTTLDENGNLVLPKGNAGNFYGAYWRDVRTSDHYFLDAGTYKVVYLFNIAADSERTDTLLKPFQKNGDAEWRFNENGVTEEIFAQYAVGKKIAVSFPLTTTSYFNDFEIGGWKSGNFSGTFDGVYICSADCDVTEAFPDYELITEESPRYFNGGATRQAEEGSYTPSLIPRLASDNVEITTVKVDGVEATRTEDTFTVEVDPAETHNVEVTLADEKASFVVEDGKITVTAENRKTTKEYTLVINEKAPALSNNTEITSVTVDGVAATITGDTITVTVPAATSHSVTVVTADPDATVVITDGKITVTAADGTTVKVYTLVITEQGGNTPGGTTPGGNTPGGSTGGTTGGNKPGVSTPKNGTAVVGGKLTLYKNGKKVTGSKAVVVGKSTYVLKGSVVQTSGKAKYKVVKVGKKGYVVNKKGIVQKKKMLKVGKRRYVVGKKGVIVKAKKKYTVAKVGKKKYIVNKKGYVQMKKKTYKVGKARYKVGKKGVAKKKK